MAIVLTRRSDSDRERLFRPVYMLLNKRFDIGTFICPRVNMLHGMQLY